MGPQQPTTNEVKELIIAQLEESFNTIIPLFPKAFNRVLAQTLAAVFTTLWKYGGFIFQQYFVSKATIKQVKINGQFVSPLKELGRLYGVEDPDPGTNAQHVVDITVTNQTGVLPSGSQLIGGFNGVTYVTTGDVLLDAEVVQATVKAVEDQTKTGGVGSIGNLEPGTKLPFANPLDNVVRETVVVSTVVTGADAESTSAYRERVTDRVQKVPQGGAYADYERWAEEAPGIIKVFPYTGACPGQVELYCEATVESSGNDDGIPTDAQLTNVRDNYINQDVTGLASRRNTNALPNTYPIRRTGWRVAVNGIRDVDNLASTQRDIEESTAEYFLGREPYIEGLTIPPRKDRVNKSAVSGQVEDVVSAHGGVFDSIDLSFDVQSLINSAYTGDSADLSATLTGIKDARFSRSGFELFVLAGSVIYQFDLTAEFDVNTLSDSGNSFDVSNEEAAPEGFTFSDPGTKLFVVGGNAIAYEYDVPSPYDFSQPVVYSSTSLDISPQESNPVCVEFDLFGRRMIITGSTGAIYSYNTPISFSLSGAQYNSFGYNVAANAPNPVSFRFSDRGERFTVLDAGGTAYEYSIGIPYDFGSIVNTTGESAVVNDQDATPKSLLYNTDKSQFFVLGSTTDSIYTYDTGVAEVGLTQIYTLGKGEKSKQTTVNYF